LRENILVVEFLSLGGFGLIDEFIDELDLPENESLDEIVRKQVGNNEQPYQGYEGDPPVFNEDKVRQRTQRGDGHGIQQGDLPGADVFSIKHSSKIGN
jgi:hypothetical protein